MEIAINIPKTREYVNYLKTLLSGGVTSSNAGTIVRNLGAHIEGMSSRFLLWHPRIADARNVYIEFYILASELNYDKPDQHANVMYYRFEAHSVGEFACLVMNHVPAGNRSDVGAFYQFVLEFDDNAQPEVVRDPMAQSLPYGIHAPAELYDIGEMFLYRRDTVYYNRLANRLDRTPDRRIGPSSNLLEIHVPTSTTEGTLHSLTRRFRHIASKIEQGAELTAHEKNLSGFDGIELMPVDPVIENPEKHRFWRPIQQPDENGTEITVHLKKPVVTNWGYDVVLFGASALNPSMLSTGRPHEMLELIETLHNFPSGPVKVVLDVVYNHVHQDAAALLPGACFAGDNRYGKNVDFSHPLVRAMILEMYRRKMNYGFDGARVDAAQDFTYYNTEQEELVHDDELLKELSEVRLDIAGTELKPWMIFEDGRPWPRDDWKLAATCRDVTERQKHAYQWSPLIFAYNEPYTFTFWVSRWWRLREQFRYGEKWITGYANHDTMRRGTRRDPDSANVNTLLGNSLKMVLDNAYNHPSATLLMNAFLPGVPMDFLQALGNTPWSFFRNTDTRYALKVVSEEAFFCIWEITEIEYRNSKFFKKIKDLGFRTLSGLRRFARVLHHLVRVTDYRPDVIAEMLNRMEPSFEMTDDWSVEHLHRFAEAWMQDVFEYCNVDMHADYIDTRRAAFNLTVRKYRLNNTWLGRNFGENDFLHYREPVDGSVIFYGYRKDDRSGKEIILLANMEGQARQVTATALPLPVHSPEKWNVALASPSVRAKKIDHPFRLSISQGILFETSDQ